MAVLRGVESGFTIVRAAKQGLLTISDNRGRILAQQDAATVPLAYLIATVPVRHDSTLYARRGDWFAWLNIAGLVALLFSRAREQDPAFGGRYAGDRRVATPVNVLILTLSLNCRSTEHQVTL